MGLKKKKPAKKKKLNIQLESTLFTTFVGEYVEIITTGAITSKVPLVTHGYLLDMDEDYYYLSDNAQSVSKCVKISAVIHIEIGQVKSVFDEILENTPTARNAEEGN